MNLPGVEVEDEQEGQEAADGLARPLVQLEPGGADDARVLDDRQRAAGVGRGGEHGLAPGPGRVDGAAQRVRRARQPGADAAPAQRARERVADGHVLAFKWARAIRPDLPRPHSLSVRKTTIHTLLAMSALASGKPRCA